jgi:hypothetical protein
MKIVFDLDGVLRDLNGYLNTKFGVPIPEEWFWKYQNKDIYDWVAQDNYSPLVYAPPTQYYWIVKHCFETPEFWTNQSPHWQAKTKLWLDLHFPNGYEVRYFDNGEKRKALDEETDAWLIEDNPTFTSWDRILLIDHPYNRHIKDVIRIKGLEDLDQWIMRLLEENMMPIN